MLPYLFPLILCLNGCIKYDNHNRKNVFSSILYGFLFCYLVLLIGFRFEIGGDSLTYEAYYKHAARSLEDWSFDQIDIYQPGFTFLMAVPKYYFGKDFVYFQLLHSFIVNVLLFVFVAKNTRYKFTALTLILYAVYLYFLTEVLREVVAIMIFSLSYPVYKNREWIVYILIILFACLFHPSAIVLLLLPFLRNLKLNRYFIFYFIGTIIAAMFSKKLFPLLGIDFIIEKAEGNAADFVGFSMMIAPLLKGLVFPAVFACFVKFGTSYRLQFENYIAIMILIGGASAVYPLIFGRTLNYFYLFLLLSFADYINNAIKSRLKPAKANMCLLLTLFIICYLSSYLVLGGWYRYWIPYKSHLFI